ncbi:MAG TPA: M20/M25/M40 family metallo-hydrolase [Blastocatellia bacterium]|nr:M20/M25/M40 family metallo-hydrolase [Blastocatellia bacterium]
MGISFKLLSLALVLSFVALLAPADMTRAGTLSLTTNGPSETDWTAYEDMAVDLMRQYLRINTSNPPGHELETAAFLKSILDREGIPNQVFEYLPGRANIIARIKGDGSKRPIILLSHMDVVTADPAMWRVDPFSATILDGSIYGRGALDMKSIGLLDLMTMIILAREKPHLSRDVIFLATADEEVGDSGSIWMIANKSELFKDAEYLITEGGDNLREGDEVRYIGVDVAEKAPYWLTLTATGEPGHGSRPIADSAPNRLARAMFKIVEYQTPIQVLPAVERFFRDIAPLQPPELRTKFLDVKDAIKDPEFLKYISSKREYNYLFRNTIALTMMSGSRQTNVIPNSASCSLDIRLLPGQDPTAFLSEIQSVIGDPTIKIENVNGFKPPNSSPIDTDLFRTISEVEKTHYPSAIVTTRLLSGYTESQLYRALGIVAYGWSPIATTTEENQGVHGNNERITVANVRSGTRETYEVVSQVAR